MLALAAIHTACHAFVDYKGHVMGVLMERDVLNELFEHYQKRSFKFYDEHMTGQLMTRISNDTFDLAELYHHGPEDIVISLLNFVGAFAILMYINVHLAFIALPFIPVMGIYEFYTAKKMYAALRKSSNKIGDINAQVEDSIAGIRVVKSFTNGSERAVQNSLEKLRKNRTTLVIAHRLSTIRNTKRILLLTDNGIEEQGSHEELIALEAAPMLIFITCSYGLRILQKTDRKSD